MSAERLEQLFAEAIDLPPPERMAFLEEACADEPGLLRRLADMVQAHARAERLAFLTPRIPAPTSEQPGQRIGPYLIQEQLGEGGWGVVFLAEQEKPVRRRVAVKVIKAGLDTRKVIARFEAEREALARMDHPNIAKVLDAGATEAGRPYFVMELVSSPCITEYCDQKKLRVSDRLELFAKVCQAVQHAHQKGIIHRDLKPSNILVADHDGMPIPKIIDFGIAKATEGRLTDGTVYTGGPHMMGTPAYMSPEQTATPSPNVDTRSDIYSLGVILYELLVGKTPFDAKKLQDSGWEEICRTIREEDPLRPSVLLATLSEKERTAIAADRSSDGPHLTHRVSGDLDWILMKCLAKERDRRYETANGLALDLRRHLAAEPVTARPPSATYRLQRLVVRNKLAFAAIGAVTIALVVGLTAAILGWRVARTERDKAAHNLYAADMNLAAQAIAVGNWGHALRLLGSYRPTAGRDDLRGWEWRYLRNRCQSQEQFTLPEHEVRVHALVFSPDSKTLVSGDMEGVIRIWNLALKEQLATHRIGGLLQGLAISPDGRALIIGWPDGVTICDGPSFTKVRQWPGAKGPIVLSPDGRTLITAGPDSATVWDAATLRKLHGSTNVLPPRSKMTFSPDGSLFAMNVESGEGVEVRIWNAPALREKGFAEPPVSVLQRGDNTTRVTLAFSSHAELLVTGQLEDDGQEGVRLWDPKTGLPLSNLNSGAEVLGIVLLPDGKTMLTYNHEQAFVFGTSPLAPTSCFSASFPRTKTRSGKWRSRPMAKCLPAAARTARLRSGKRRHSWSSRR